MNFAHVAATLTMLAATAQLSAAQWPDQLRPLDPGESKYRSLLHRRLCPTPFDCGRIIVMPPFQKAEIAVSVYSRRSASGATEYYATSVEAADNLRDWSDAGRLPGRAKGVKTRRIDAPIPEKTAKLLKEVWVRMLARTSLRTELRRSAPRDVTELIYTDPTELEFCVGTGAHAVCGETPWVPSLPKKMLRFTDLAEALPSYCAARAEARPDLAQKLTKQAETILRTP